MIEFRRLELEKEGKWLTFDIAISDVEDAEGNLYYDGVVIQEIQLYTADTFDKNNVPSDKGISLYSLRDGEEGIRHIHRTVEMPVQADLVFLYVQASKSSRYDLPCSYKGVTDIGVAFDRAKLFKAGLNLLNNLDGCSPNVNFINSLLQMKAFEIALKTGNFDRAVEWWNKFFKENTVKKNCASTKGTPYTPVKTCGCHGR